MFNARKYSNFIKGILFFFITKFYHFNFLQGIDIVICISSDHVNRTIGSLTFIIKVKFRA